VANFLNLLSALGTRMAPQYEPWAVALAALRRVRQLFAQAAQVKPGWQRCSGLLERYVATHVTGQFVRGVQLEANAAPGLTFQARATLRRLARRQPLQRALASAACFACKRAARVQLLPALCSTGRH
jgi:hypothetical protein